MPSHPRPSRAPPPLRQSHLYLPVDLQRIPRLNGYLNGHIEELAEDGTTDLIATRLDALRVGGNRTGSDRWTRSCSAQAHTQPDLARAKTISETNDCRGEQGKGVTISTPTLPVIIAVGAMTSCLNSDMSVAT